MEEGFTLTDLVLKKSKLIADKSPGYKLHVWPPKPTKQDPLVDIMIENGYIDFQIKSNLTMSSRVHKEQSQDKRPLCPNKIVIQQVMEALVYL